METNDHAEAEALDHEPSSEDDDRELDGIAIIWGLTKRLKCLKELVGALRAKA